MNQFSEILRAWRMAKGYNVPQAIAWLNVSRRSYQEWEAGFSTPRNELEIMDRMKRNPTFENPAEAARRLLEIGDPKELCRTFLL